MPAFLLWPVAIAAALGACVVIYRFVAAIVRLADCVPVMVQISEEFSKNGGSTLRDSVDRIEAKVDDAAVKVEEAAVKVEEAASLVRSWSTEREAVMARLALVELQVGMTGTGSTSQVVNLTAEA